MGKLVNIMRCDPNEIPWLETVDKGNVGHVGTARGICREQLKTKKRNGDVSFLSDATRALKGLS